MTDLKTYIGLRVRTARQKAGLTQEQLSGRIEKAVETISNIERGHSSTSLETLEKLSIELDIPLGTFFEGRRSDEDRSEERIVLEGRLSGSAVKMDDKQLELLIDIADRLNVHFEPGPAENL